MPRGQPVDPTARARVIELARAGKGRNEIAREVGINVSTVTKIAKENGLAFDRAATAVAVAVRSTDLKARRQTIVSRLYGLAERDLDRLEAPTFTATARAANGTTVTTVLNVVPSDEARALSAAIGQNLNSAAKTAAIDADQGDLLVKGLLGAALDGIREKYGVDPSEAGA